MTICVVFKEKSGLTTRKVVKPDYLCYAAIIVWHASCQSFQ